MFNRNHRFVVFTVAVITILIASNILPASAQLSQWRSLNPTRDGTLGRVAPAPFLYGVQMLAPNYGWAVGGTCNIYSGSPSCNSTNHGFALFWDGVRWRQTLVPASAGTLTSVFIVDTNNVWAVGTNATIVHWDGTSWVTAVVPSRIQLFSVYMLPGGMDGWAVGNGTNNILRWSGMWPTGAWSAPASPDSTKQLRGVFLISPTEGWAVGKTGTIFHWDGAGWMDLTASSPTPKNLYSVSMVSPTDGWAVGASSTIIRWNGASWTGPMVPPTTGIDYRSIHMVSSNSGWIAGNKNTATDEGLLLSWDGVAWTIVRSRVTVPLNSIFMLSDGSVGSAVGDAETIIHWNASTWLAQTSPTYVDLTAVSMVASNDGWAVGTNGTIFRYDGTSWAHYETLPSNVTLFGLDMVTSSYGWAVGAPNEPKFPPTILRWNGAAWTVVSPSGVAVNQTLYAVDSVSQTESWAVGNNATKGPATMLKWDGSIWTSVPSGTPTNSSLRAIKMLSSTDGWAVGCGPTKQATCQYPIIVRWNGLAWSAVTPPSGIKGLMGIFMLSPTDGWAVGSANSTIGGQATIIHWDGSQWTSVPGPYVGDTWGYLSSIYMASPNDGWAVGYGYYPAKSLIVHWDGMTWNVVATLPLPPSMVVSLNSVFMLSSLDGWIVSNQGLILHYGPESVPGTTTSYTTSTSFTTIVSTITSTTTSTTSTGTMTPASGGTWGVPGFPIESILTGLLGGLIALTIIRRRRRP
jgi:photosystem II stability/assembly factor-like uncharacterized protein